mmetsp:Transcript_16215/g.38867  ORF Transcript_16215/g.38867 Transcript_16215/m.38867 type:complete len:612 (-) Transcript_16215:400-2235(-)
MRRIGRIPLAVILLLTGVLVAWQLRLTLSSSPNRYPAEPNYSVLPSYAYKNDEREEQWGPEAYLRLARSGPRRCIGVPCYIVDVVSDPYQPRIFLSMLGLPASDIDRPQRGSTTNVSFVDIRTGEWTVVEQSRSLTNATHGFLLLLRGSGGDHEVAKRTRVAAPCALLKHAGATALGAFYESMTYACSLPPKVHEMDCFNGTVDCKVRVDVLLAPMAWVAKGGVGKLPYHLNLNGLANPFYINNNHQVGSSAVTSGLFNSVSRRGSIAPSAGGHYRSGGEGGGGSVEDSSAAAAAPKKLRMSVCLIGVNYFSLQHREVIQHYITSGFDHVYLGVPQWPTSVLFNKTWSLLGDFVIDGSMSIIVSEYAEDFIEPERFKKNFTYAPQGHKSSFVNTCILVARAAGDDFVFVGDFDELIEHIYGSETSIAEVVADQLSARNISLQTSLTEVASDQLAINSRVIPDTCAIEMGSVFGVYHSDRVGFSDSGRIVDKLAGVKWGDDSVATYGKSILNARLVLRAGLHGPAYCEAQPGPELSLNLTRPSIDLKKINQFRSNPKILRTLHLRDSYMQRASSKDVKDAKKGGLVSYYARDWSGLVYTDLDQRAKIWNRLP